jgi:hypothetical protein
MHRLTTQDIVKKAVGNSKFKQTYAGLHKLLSTNTYRLMREGNTLFLVHIIEKATCEIAVLNGDTKDNMMQNFYGFLKALKKCNYEKVYMESNSITVMHHLQDKGYNIKGVNNNHYLLEL